MKHGRRRPEAAGMQKVKVKRPLENSNKEGGCQWRGGGGRGRRGEKDENQLPRHMAKVICLDLATLGNCWLLPRLCSPLAVAHEFKMRRSSGPRKLCFQRFYLRKISSRTNPPPRSPRYPRSPLPCCHLVPAAVADLILS